jgi:hypothetical protein
MKIRFRQVTVKVYRKTPRYPFYRIAYRADGKRVVRDFKRLNEAKQEAEKKARELAHGNEAAALSEADAHAYKFALRKLTPSGAERSTFAVLGRGPGVALSQEFIRGGLELMKRDKVNLDIFWLKDDALEESANLPAPEIIAQEITDGLQAALEQFATITEDLK